MRFTRTKWTYEQRMLTQRRRAAILLSQRRQRERLPLLAPIIADGQKSVEETAQAQDSAEAQWVDEARAMRARWWRKARAALFALSDNERALVTSYWNAHHWLPGTPEYLADLVWSFTQGNITPDKMAQDVERMLANRVRLGPRAPRPAMDA